MNSAVFDAASNLLAAGQIIALPTETVYGLAVDPRQPAALKKLFALKRRPYSQPISLLTANADILSNTALRSSFGAHILAQNFWPGALTLIVQTAPNCPWYTTADGSQANTIGIRRPNHTLAQALLRHYGAELAVSSANHSGQPSLLSADAVQKKFGTEVKMIIDGGICALGEASTVLDCSADKMRILRRGALDVGHIEQVLTPHGIKLFSAQA